MIASAWQVEVEPLLSNYEMYARTFESPEAYDRERRHGRLRAIAVDDPSTAVAETPRRGERLLFSLGGTDISTRVRGIPNGMVKLTKSSSIDPQDIWLQPVANPPCWASKAAASLNLTIPTGERGEGGGQSLPWALRGRRGGRRIAIGQPTDQPADREV